MNINKDANSFKKILIVNLGGIGDLLLSTPALRALRACFYDSKITLMVIPRAADALKFFSVVDKIIIFDKNNIFKALFALLKLRKEQFDLAVNMRTIASERSAKKIKLLLDIINPKIKAGRDTEGRGAFFDIKIPEPDIGEKKEMAYDIDMVKALGIEPKDNNIVLEPDLKSIEAVRKILEDKGVTNETVLIGIHPGGMPSHRWPIENFVKLINALRGEKTRKFVITGGKEEAELAAQLIKLADGGEIICLAGKLNFNELTALIARFSLFITNDTGPMHIAAVLKTPLIAIFGPGYITRYDPRAISDKAVVLYEKVDCSPCNRAICESMKCLKAIQPKEVVKIALALLGDKVKGQKLEGKT